MCLFVLLKAKTKLFDSFHVYLTLTFMGDVRMKQTSDCKTFEVHYT